MFFVTRRHTLYNNKYIYIYIYIIHTHMWSLDGQKKKYIYIEHQDNSCLLRSMTINSRSHNRILKEAIHNYRVVINECWSLWHFLHTEILSLCTIYTYRNISERNNMLNLKSSANDRANYSKFLDRDVHTVNIGA